jgi:hypothetical protein
MIGSVIHSPHIPLASIGLAVLLSSSAGALPPIEGPLDTARGARALSVSRFDPARDVFSYANELIWDYGGDDRGAPPEDRRRAGPREEHRNGPVFGQRCMEMARQARQFFHGARFDPSLPRVSEEAYASRVERILGMDARRDTPASERITIPGFASLREFSREYETLLKQHSGSRWRSYFQRGNWRMLFPFTRGHQRRTADALVHSIERGRPPIVHVMNFPWIDVNHATLLYRAVATADEIRFEGYDPNTPDMPLELRYEQENARFVLAETPYFAGGPVRTYEIYHGWLY